MDEIIKVENVSKKYADFSALNGINISIASKEWVMITGKSGSGKTTLLNIIAAVELPTSGNVFYNGNDIIKYNDREIAKYRNRHVGLIYQQFLLEEEYTVYQNVELPLVIRNIKKREYDKMIKDILTELGLIEMINKKVKLLSGGERQRVAIARTLASSPDVILADEPTGNLDSENAKNIMEILKRLNSRGYTIIMVTHDESLLSYAKRIIRLKDGRVI